MTAMFNGKWVIRYDPDAYSYTDIFKLIVNGTPGKKKENPFENLSVQRVDVEGDEPIDSLRQANRMDIKKIALLNPAIPGDKRWDSIHLTTSNIFLGSALTNRSFEVVTGNQLLPVPGKTHAVSGIDDYSECDMLGFTLFEDHFLPFQSFLTQLTDQQGYKGLIAAGGPMITLNPLQAALHLPQINLLVRGESELVLPRLLTAFNKGSIAEMLEHDGFMFHLPGVMVISNFSVSNQPAHFNGFTFNLDFLQSHHVQSGLEINVSRGCARGCIFCSSVQGKSLRMLPVPLFHQLLDSFDEKLQRFECQNPDARTININDDDILQNPDYTAEIFNAIKQHQFKLWGIQTSINSFFHHQKIHGEIVDMVADKALYMADNPLVWLGTDAFLKERGKKLAKVIPAQEQMMQLVEEFQQREVRNYHYWISSDHRTDWLEFAREFIFIFQLKQRFSTFGLIAHSPFLVPYSSTPIYRLLTRSPETRKLVHYKKILESSYENFTFPLVERVETPFTHLNRLLKNERLDHNRGFFDHLHQKDYLQALITLYNFLKQERLDAESRGMQDFGQQLMETEGMVEEFIGGQMSL